MKIAATIDTSIWNIDKALRIHAPRSSLIELDDLTHVGPVISLGILDLLREDVTQHRINSIKVAIRYIWHALIAALICVP